MRWILVGSSLALVIMPVQARAQVAPDSTRFGVAFGPTWNAGGPNLTGLQLRGEYYLTPRNRIFGLRLETGIGWTPTQSFSTGSFLYGDGTRFTGRAQATDVSVGVTATFAPWPRAPVSPYLVTGIVVAQKWNGGRGYYIRPDGTPETSWSPAFSVTNGVFASPSGIGMRFNLWNRPVQLELRNFLGGRRLTVGTSFHF